MLIEVSFSIIVRDELIISGSKYGTHAHGHEAHLYIVIYV